MSRRISRAELRNFLIKNNLKISTGESCTGGLISSLLTDIPGASGFLEQSFVVYCEKSKEKFLGVNPDTIKKHGVVSYDVAKEMALGLVERYSDVGIATTGYLGPANNGKSQVGKVFIGLAKGKKHKVIEYRSHLQGRVKIKKDVAKKAIEFLCEFLGI